MRQSLPSTLLLLQHPIPDLLILAMAYSTDILQQR